MRRDGNLCRILGSIEVGVGMVLVCFGRWVF